MERVDGRLGEKQLEDVDVSEPKLTEREMLIAQEAAKIAVKELADHFYQQVGRTVITKVLVWIGMLAAGFAVGKGWIPKL